MADQSSLEEAIGGVEEEDQNGLCNPNESAKLNRKKEDKVQVIHPGNDRLRMAMYYQSYLQRTDPRIMTSNLQIL